MQNLTYSSSDGVSKFYDFVNEIWAFVDGTKSPITVKIDGATVTITQKIVLGGTRNVVQFLNQYKNHTRR